ncbi:MAG: histidinol-phosphate transaminase [Acidobacteriales bacterium]|nr:histidinol-phosphate transaminase [Terriglobales bacterium]
MADFEKFIPEHIRALTSYTPGKPMRQAQKESGVECIKMASNENPLGPSPRALEAMRSAAAQANFYPDMEISQLRQELARRYQLDPQQVLVTAGSTQLLDLIARTLLTPGKNALSSERSFIVYPLVTRSAGGKYVEVPMQNDAFDLEAIAEAVTGDTRVIYLANPNNPTGTMFDAAATDRFLARIPEHVVVVLDEAYCDFAEAFARQRGVTYSRSLDYVREGRKVIVLRTFSKAHGLAGLRVGYGLGPPEFLRYLARVRPAFSVSSVAEAAALAALEDVDHIRKTVENNTVQAPELAKQLSAMGFHVVPASASFIYFDVGEDAAEVSRRIQAAGVIVRPLTAWGAPTAIRVTVGTPAQNQRFLAALRNATERAAVR